MVATILIPLDGSELAERAIPYAAHLARRAGADLLLVRAATAYQSSQEPERELNRAAERLRGEGLDVEIRLLPTFAGEVAEVLADFASQRQVSAIVMSTHGRGGLGRWLFGSIADQVLRRATEPVILVPAATDHAWTTERPLRILVPLDGSSLAEAVLPAVTDRARALGAELVLVQVVDVPGQLYVEYPSVVFDVDAQVAVASEYVEGVARRLRDEGLTVETHVPVGYAPSAIVSTATEHDVDMIAMATHGRGGFARLVLGSVATGTLQRAHVPVMLVHPEPAPVAAAATDEVPAPEPVAAPVGPTIELTLSARDLELVERGLTSLMFQTGQDWLTTTPVRDLLARVKSEEEMLTGRAGSAADAIGRR